MRPENGMRVAHGVERDVPCGRQRSVTGSVKGARFPVDDEGVRARVGSDRDGRAAADHDLCVRRGRPTGAAAGIVRGKEAQRALSQL